MSSTAALPKSRHSNNMMMQVLTNPRRLIMVFTRMAIAMCQ